MTRGRLRREPRWLLRVLLGSSGLTFLSTVTRNPRSGLGGPVLYFVVLGVSGLLVVALTVLLLTGARDR